MKKKYTKISVAFQPMNLDATVTASCTQKISTATDESGEVLTSFPEYDYLYCSTSDSYGNFFIDGVCDSLVKSSAAIEIIVQNNGLFTS